ncbi:Protein of unknown function [Lysobacter sp. yr284]|uniref:DUF2894 domain-containing protein n=1 Tax=Lysobacter sp. yr284 TaxID=1761791 RepID=UPI000895E582|nr:DUF2894 domain-containing protein [Lysobacter sp. yr284]SDY79924.1 Protein of unknown function [Lysobacter sp. yr284]
MTQARANAGGPDPRATLEAWRAQGEDRRDRAGFARIDALERRAAAQDGELRRVLDARVREMMIAYAGELERSAVRAREAAVGKADAATAASPAEAVARKGGKRKPRAGAETAPAPAPTLAELTQRLEALVATREAASADAPRAAFPQLAALDEFRMRFSRLRMDRQLRESLEPSSTDAGPLNSGRLVHRALSTMQALAPEYLQQFMAYVDALAWMERLGGVAEADEPAVAAGGGKRGRKRRE